MASEFRRLRSRNAAVPDELQFVWSDGALNKFNRLRAAGPPQINWDRQSNMDVPVRAASRAILPVLCRDPYVRTVPPRRGEAGDSLWPPDRIAAFFRQDIPSCGLDLSRS